MIASPLFIVGILCRDGSPMLTAAAAHKKEITVIAVAFDSIHGYPCHR